MANCHICDILPICPFASPVEKVCSSFKPKRKTNADKTRQMSDEELAFLISNGCPPASVKPCRAYLSIDGDTNCADCWLDWLRQEAKT